MEDSVTPEMKKENIEEKENVTETMNNPVEEAAEAAAVNETAEAANDVADTDAAEAAEDAAEGTNSFGVKIKEQLKGKITKVGAGGALVDIGNSIPAFVHISQIPRPEGKETSNSIHDLVSVGDEVDVWVKRVKDGRVELTMNKPLALEWREIKKDMVVKGTVLRLEKFGAFVEIGAERPGLVHISEMAHSYVRQPSDVLKEGDEIEAQVLEVNRRKKQIKLSMKALQPEPAEKEEPEVKTSTAPRSTSARAQQLKEGKVSTGPREKTVRPRKNTHKREEINQELVDFNLNSGNEAEEETAMSIAIKAAMEKAQNRKRQNDDKKKKAVSTVQEDILNRTLNNKVG